jgi:hypothetical protein
LLFRSSAATTAPEAPTAPPARGVTRRRLLATGGAAGAAAAFGRFPAVAGAADQAVPDYLGRSSYLALSTPTFAVGTTSAKLEAVGDLLDLPGSEDAFSLIFSAAAPIEPAIQSFSHPDLGQFEFFVAPIEGRGLYEVVVNRSVNAARHYPRQPGHVGPAAPPKPGAKPPPGAPRVRRGHVKRVNARRLARGLACSVALEPGADVKSATVWFMRGGIVVATTHVKHVHGHRINVSVPTKHRPRGGRYDITVQTKDRHGHTDYRVAKLALG